MSLEDAPQSNFSSIPVAPVSSILPTPQQVLSNFTTNFPVILSFLLFPIYGYVGYKNRLKDKETAIFLITNHFFKANCLVHLLAYPTVPIAFWVIVTAENDRLEPVVGVPILIAVILLLILYLSTTSVCSVLIVYQAIQRFLLYFSPTIGESLTIRRTRFFVVSYIFIPILSFASVYPYIIGEYLKQQRIHENNPDLEVKVWYNPVFLASAALRIVLINTLMFISAILYLIMIWKIQKFKSMMSQTTIKPEKYIMYQVIILSAWQLYSLVLFFVRSGSNQFFSIETFMIYLEATIISTFPSIQMSYLLCNKANVTEMWRIVMRIIGYQSTVTPIKQQVTAIRSTSDAP